MKTKYVIVKHNIQVKASKLREELNSKNWEEIIRVSDCADLDPKVIKESSSIDELKDELKNFKTYWSIFSGVSSFYDIEYYTLAEWIYDEKEIVAEDTWDFSQVNKDILLKELEEEVIERLQEIIEEVEEELELELVVDKELFSYTIDTEEEKNKMFEDFLKLDGYLILCTNEIFEIKSYEINDNKIKLILEFYY